MITASNSRYLLPLSSSTQNFFPLSATAPAPVDVKFHKYNSITTQK